MSTVLSASSITGDAVRNPQGDDLGKIEDLMIDVDSGKVRFAVLSFGGFLGMGDKLFAVPLEAMTVHPESHQLVFDFDKQRLENAPGFDKDDWPTDIGGDWGRDVYTYWDVTYTYV